MNEEQNLEIDGKTFDFGWTRSSAPFYTAAVVTSLNPNGSYSKFKARIGLDASDSANTSGKIVILADDAVTFTKTLTLNGSEDVNLDIADVQRLEIKQYPSKEEGLVYAIDDPILAPK
jgi:hypothetical protein